MSGRWFLPLVHVDLTGEVLCICMHLCSKCVYGTCEVLKAQIVIFGMPQMPIYHRCDSLLPKPLSQHMVIATDLFSGLF